jgi:thiosulfate dehydrogenase (quinone) large subunit
MPASRRQQQYQSAPPPIQRPQQRTREQQIANVPNQGIPPLAILPLRFFLGVTFLYAGLDKIGDPGFLQAGSTTYIGSQLTAFAKQSPLQDLLVNMVIPNAVTFGTIIMWGEVLIGLGTLFGALFRPAAFFGALLSLMLWLTASWQVKPYFYGSDIFVFAAWITLACTGTRGVLALDPILGSWLAQRLKKSMPPQNITRLLVWLDMIPIQYSGSRAVVDMESRRNFLNSMAIGVAGTIISLFVWGNERTTGTLIAPSGSDAAPTPTPGTPAPGTTPTPSSNAIANLNSLSPNSAVSFKIPSSRDPGVLVRLSNGNVVAYDATCTHEGCTVQYDSGSRILACPCHGAEFDPAAKAQVLGGPTRTPLSSVAINIDQKTGDITLQ